MTNDFSDPRYWVMYELMRGGIEDREQLENLAGMNIGRQLTRVLFVRLDTAYRHLIEYPTLPALTVKVRCCNCGATLAHVPCNNCGRTQSHYKLRSERPAAKAAPFTVPEYSESQLPAA